VPAWVFQTVVHTPSLSDSYTIQWAWVSSVTITKVVIRSSETGEELAKFDWWTPSSSLEPWYVRISENNTSFTTISVVRPLNLIYYPDDYIDNDADGRLLLYGYILEESGLYNVLWSNGKIKNYISMLPDNTNSSHIPMSTASSAYVNIDINSSYKAYLYRINSSIYNQSNEIVVEELLTWTWQSAGIWYLQNDLSLSSSTGSAYNFDFVNNDYALFLENTSTDTALYQIRWYDANTGSGIYINPLDDRDSTILKHFGSHIFIDDKGQLIGDVFETYWFK